MQEIKIDTVLCEGKMDFSGESHFLLSNILR